MMHINIALLLMAGTFVLGWLFEGMCLRISRSVSDARNWRDLAKREALADYEAKHRAAEQAAWDAQVKDTVLDW